MTVTLLIVMSYLFCCKQRRLFVQLNEHILGLGTYFMQASQRPVSVPKNKVPSTLSYWQVSPSTMYTLQLIC